MSVEENIEKYRRLILDGVEEDIDELKKVLSLDFIRHYPHWTGVRGPEEYRNIVTSFKGAYSEQQFAIDDIFGVDNKVVARWRFQGRHTGQMEGGSPPTNQIWKMAVCSIARWEEGKIVEEWFYPSYADPE